MTMLNNALPLIRVRILPRFPAVVIGADGIKVEREAGVYTIAPAVDQLAEIASVPTTGFVSVWDEQSGVYSRIPASAFVGGGGAVSSVNGKTGTVVLVASDIAGVGDMTAAVYDPTSKAADAFDMTNMVEGTTAKIFSATERTKLSGIASGATANSSDATLLNRANHTGTQSADTITDGTTNKAYTATEKTKLAGIASGATANTGTVTSVAVAVPASLTSSGGPLTTSGTITIAHASGYQGYTTTEATKLSGIASGATANSSDATLLARANHTGTQSYTTITGLGTLATISYPGGTTNFLRADGTFAAPPGGGSGGGDMYAAVYDPNGVADDAFDMDNMAEGTTSKILTAAERTKLTGIEALADVTDATNVAAAGAFMKSVDDSDDLTEGVSKLLMTAAERSKLAGVATGATANSADATLLARANHTGTQTASTISDFSTAADARIAAAVGVSVQAYDADLTTWAGVTPGTGVATFLATPTSANLAAAITNETGSGSLVFATSPTLVTPNLGTPSAVTLTSGTGLPISTGVSGLGTGVATFLATPSSANLAAAVTNETGSGALVFATSPTLVTPVLGAASATSLTLTTDLAIADGGTGASTASAALAALGGLPLAGGTMTGAITLAADPASAMQPATKQYVDAAGGSGRIGQVLQTSYNTAGALTTAIPADNSIPTSSEGTQIMSQAITPASSSSQIRATVGVFGTPRAATTVGTVALFRGTTCIQARGFKVSSGTVTGMITLDVIDAPATGSSVTYSVRVGPDSGTFDINSFSNGSAAYSTAGTCTLILEEILP